MSVDRKISVIVPVYHVEKYLARCVNSILAQTYTNIEVILVDDGSDDNCPAMCDEYARQDSRIRVLHRDNGGLSAARNSGIKAATGDVIALVDSDDYIGSNMFKHLMEQMEENDADIAMCDYQYVHENDEAELDSNLKDAGVLLLTGVQAQNYMYESYINRVTYTVAWNKLYRRELFDGITYPEGRIHEDEARTHELLYRAKRIVYVKAPYYNYLQRDDSIVGSTVTLKKLQLMDAYADRLSFYRSKGEDELWCKEAEHSMHMMCYIHKMLEDAGIKDNIAKQPQLNRLRDELGNYRSIKGLSKKTIIEILFFRIGYGLYYSIWKNRK